MPSTLFFPLILLLLCPEGWGYTAPEDKVYDFSERACPAFLTFTNVAYLAGTTVELPCHCKPQRVQSVVWFFKKHSDGSQETRALSDHHGNKLVDPSQISSGSDLRSRFSIRLFSLFIYRSGPDDSGIYICGSTHKDFFLAYDVDIQEAQMIMSAPRLAPENHNEARQMSRPNSSQLLYEVFTSFQPWSVCDRCGIAGEQIRVGLCYIYSNYLHVRYRRTNQTIASCGSGGVPSAFVHLKQSKVQAKLEVRTCEVTCQNEDLSPSKTNIVMEFFGQSSASRPVAPVIYRNHRAEEDLVLSCPGAEPNMVVAWDLGSQPIYRFNHQAETELNITSYRPLIDNRNHLVFKPAKTQNSGIYHCWLEGRRAAKIHLLVYAHLGQGQSMISHPEFQTAVKTVVQFYGIMLAVFCLLLFCRAGVQHCRETSVEHVD